MILRKVLARSALIFALVVAAQAYSINYEQLDKGDEDVMRDLLAALNYEPWANYRKDWLDPCYWVGVECGFGHVTNLVIGAGEDFYGSPTSSITGYIPESITRLKYLQGIQVECNSEMGGKLAPLPLGLINSSMTNLTTLYVVDCQVSMDIADFNLSSPNMFEVIFTSNQIYGDVTNLWCNPQMSLYLRYNLLTGDIPWAHCGPPMAYLDLHGNFLTGLGSLPMGTCFGRDSSSGLNVNSNRLEGNLTDIEGAFECFQLVSLYGNNITSTVPEQYWRSGTLDLGFNHLYGTLPAIPAAAGVHHRVLAMMFDHNELTGVIPNFPPKWMVSLTAGDNYFTSISESITQSVFTNLLMQRNRLTGTLPDYLPRYLENVDVSYNMLSGCPFAPLACNSTPSSDTNGIPSTSSSSQSHSGSTTNDREFELRTLYLAHNNFSCPIDGCLPPWARQGEFDLFLQHLDLSYNDFAGLSIGRICANTFVASHANLEGELLICLEMTYADFSFNRFNGSLPPLAINDEYFAGLGPAIIALDLSYNNLTGGISYLTSDRVSTSVEGLYQSPSDMDGFQLQSLNLTGNQMSEYEGSVSYVAASEIAFAGADFFCPALNLQGLTTTVFVSPSFYNYSRCYCDNLFFGAPTANGYNCTSLSVICEDLTCFSLNETTPTTIVANAGYYPRPTPEAATALLPCPTINPSKETYACTGQCVCAGNIGTLNCSCEHMCADGYENLFCSRCSSGYFALGLLCLQCDNTNNVAAITIACISFSLAVLSMVTSVGPPPAQPPTGRCLWVRQNKILTGIVFIQLTLLTVTTATFHAANMGVVGVSILLALLLQLAWHQSAAAIDPALRMPVDVRAMTILIQFMQVIAASVPSGFWTFQEHSAQLIPKNTLPPFSETGPAAARGIGQLNPFGVECFSTDPGQQIDIFFYWTLIVPFLLIALIWIGSGLARGCLLARRTPDYPSLAHQVRVRTRTAMIYVVNYLVFNAVVIVVQLFNCNQMGSDTYHLMAYPFIECYGTTWYKLLWVAIAVLVGYLIAFCLFIWYIRDVLRRKGLELMRARFAFFVAPFKENHWWYGLLILTRRLLLAVGLSAFPSESSIGPLMVLTTLVVALVIQTTIWPYRNPALNWMDTAQLSILIVTSAAVVLLNVGYVTFSLFARIVLLIFNVIFVVVAFVYALSPTLRKVFAARRARTEGSETSVDLVSETSPLVEHWLDNRARVNTDMMRLRDLETENAKLRQRNTFLEQENETLRRASSSVA